MITSTIIWNENLDEAPVNEYLLVRVIDDSGDNPYEYSTVGWKVHGADDIWIIENDQCCGSYIRMWAKMPS